MLSAPGLWNVDTLRRLWRAGQPFCLVEKSGTQSINDATVTDVTWQTDLIDPWGMHDTGSNTERITIPVSGRYLVFGTLAWEANAAGTRRATFVEVGVLNKTLGESLIAPSGASLSTYQPVSSVALDLQKGVYVKMTCRQDSSGALNLEANTTTAQFGVVRVG